MASLEGRRGEPRGQVHPHRRARPLGQAHQPQQRRDLGQRAASSSIAAPTGSRAIGTPRARPGTKIFSLVGKVNNTGLVEVPMGITLREIIFDDRRRHQGRQEVQGRPDRRPVAAAASPRTQLDLPVDFDALTRPGLHDGVRRHDRHGRGHLHGGRRPLLPPLPRWSPAASAPPAARARHACTTCSATSPRAAARARPSPCSRSSPSTVEATSLCALGTSAVNPVLSTLRYFRDEYLAHVDEKRCPAGVCKALISYSIDAERCNGCTLCAARCPAGRDRRREEAAAHDRRRSSASSAASAGTSATATPCWCSRRPWWTLN